MKVAIFDLDGTLFDSMWVWEKLAYNYLVERGIDPPLDLRENLKEYSLRESCDVLKERYNLSETPDEINNQMEEILKKHYFEEIELKVGAKELLEKMNKLGIKIIAATATADWLSKAASKRLGIYEYFEIFQTCRAVGIEKYDPKFYEIIIKQLDVETNEIWLFEDALHSIKAGKKCGMKVAAIRDESAKSDWDEIEENSDITFDSFNEFLENYPEIVAL
jgi:HAD superfamily hydrolase (TIGR01509 family)